MRGSVFLRSSFGRGVVDARQRGQLGVLVVAVAGVAQGVVSPLPALSAAWLPLALGLSGAFLVGNLALQYGAARLAAHTTALIMLSEVLFASASAVLLGATELTARTLAGGCLIVLAAVLAAWPSGTPSRSRQK